MRVSWGPTRTRGSTFRYPAILLERETRATKEASRRLNLTSDGLSDHRIPRDCGMPPTLIAPLLCLAAGGSGFRRSAETMIVRRIACSVVGQKSLDYASDQGAAVGMGSHQGIGGWQVFWG